VLGRKLDRHVLRSFVGPYLASVAGLAMLLVLFDLFDRVDECVRLLGRKDVGTGQALGAIGTYYAGRALSFLSEYGGLACLAGAALTVAVLYRNGEITAMRAAGVSIRRAFVPLLLFAALAGAAQMALSEYAVAPLAPAAEDSLDLLYRRKSKRGLNVNLSRRARLAVWTAPAHRRSRPDWKKKAHVNLLAGRVLRVGRTVEDLTVEIILDEPEAPRAPTVYRLKASRAEWERGGWSLSGGRFYRYWGEAAIVDCFRLSCDISPTHLESSSLGLAGTGLAELIELRNDQAARVELWGRLALPLLNVVLLLVGLPLAVLGSARGGRLLPLGAALILGAIYVLTVELGGHVGRGGDLLDLLESFRGGDWLAAMGGPLRLAVDLALGLPHLVFLAVGIVLYRRVDR
jgi:lipopolysaccharide export LptBFGC system permease protein LptF